MIESLVDLTYRGISFGRRIKLSQVRPASGYLEAASPMPVGSELVVVTDDNLAFTATVTWVHEQITGGEQAPGMTVAPVLTAEPAAAWWRARIALPDDETPKRLARNRPVTVRPRSHTKSAPLPPPAEQKDMPAIIADLEARVAAAAPVVEPPQQPSGEHVVIDDGEKTIIMEAVDPAALGVDFSGHTDPDAEPTDPGHDPSGSREPR